MNYYLISYRWSMTIEDDFCIMPEYKEGTDEKIIEARILKDWTVDDKIKEIKNQLMQQYNLNNFDKIHLVAITNLSDLGERKL
jgi:hypothetical protein